MIDAMMTIQEGFHHSISGRIVVITLRKGDNKEWDWASVEAALKASWICPIREYVRRRKKHFHSMYQEGPIYEICTGVDSMEGSSRLLSWWSQVHVPTKLYRELEQKRK